MEINPSNPGLTGLREQWQKLVVLIMKKHDLREVTFTAAEIEELIGSERMPYLVTHFKKNELALVLCDDRAQAIEYMAKNQGHG